MSQVQENVLLLNGTSWLRKTDLVTFAATALKPPLLDSAPSSLEVTQAFREGRCQQAGGDPGVAVLS